MTESRLRRAMTTKKVEPASRQCSASRRTTARARVLARYALVEEGDYFAVLGIARDASAADMRRAHDRIARELAPDAIDPGWPRELSAQKIDAIRDGGRRGAAGAERRQLARPLRQPSSPAPAATAAK